MNVRKIFNFLMSFVFAFSLLGVPAPVSAQAPLPNFNVRASTDQVETFNWPMGDTLTLTIDNPSTLADPDHTATRVVTGVLDWDSNQTYELFNLAGVYDIQVDDEIAISNGFQSKTTTVINLTFIDVDLVADTVMGTARPNQNVNIWTCHNDPCINREETADPDGNWTTNFAVPGDKGWEQATADLRAGSWIDSSVSDEDGDGTLFGWSVPNPSFSARLTENEVHGYSWPLGASVTLTIDDPMTGVGADYTDTLTVGAQNGNPNQTFVQFKPWEEGFTLKSGMTVAMSDGQTNKSYVVTNLVVTEVDPVADTVSGTAAPGTQVDVGHMYCDPSGCHGFRRVITAPDGTWVADFAHVGEDNDEQDLFDIKAGTGSEARQCDQEGECTTYGWRIFNPRLNASYEFDWISISEFSLGGNVTYTIYDAPGGNVLFGPATGPVDPKGNGWIDSQLHRTDMVPGMLIEAKDEATGTIKQLTIPRLTFERLDDVADIAYGVADPGSLVDLHINGFNTSGINVQVTAGSDGRWNADLHALGYDVQDYWWANVNLCDGENDCLTAEAPKISGSIRNDWFSVDNYSKNADITLVVYDAPQGNVIFGPHTLHTNRNGQAWIGFSEFGFDLVPGQYVVVTDSAGWSKDLLIRPVSFDDLNADGDFARGTALPGQRLSLHVTGLFSNWHDNPVTDGNGTWYTDFGAQGYDILGNMWGNVWAQDNNMDFTQDFTTPPPTISASSVQDWINGYNFSPNGQVRLQIYTTENGTLLLDQEFTAGGGTDLWVDYWQHGIDLQPGMYIVATDLITGQVSDLVLLYVTFDLVDYDLDIATGQATSGARVVVQAGNYFDSYEIATIADANSNWTADFGARGIDLTSDMWINARVYDEQGNSSQADGPRPPQFTASVTGNWVNGNNWSSEVDLNVDLYEGPGGLPIHLAIATPTDRYGNFNLNLWNYGIRLESGNYLVIADPLSGQSKELQLTDLTFTNVDFDLEQALGTAPANTRLTVGFGGRSDYLEFDLFSAVDGTWLADFAAHDFDLTLDMNGNVRMFDADGDATQADYNTPNFGVWPSEDRVEGWNWSLGATIDLEVDDPATPASPDKTGTGTVGLAPWDPSQTWFEIFVTGYDLKAGDLVTLTDGTLTKTLTVANLDISTIDPAIDTLTGTADANAEVHVWSDDGSERVNTATNAGAWSVNFSVSQNGNPVIDLIYGSTGSVWVQDEDRDQTSVWWQVAPPQCQPGDTVTGTVFENDGITPIGFASLQIEDFNTGQIKFVSTADQAGNYGCWLPDGAYRITASANNFESKYYDDTDAANATQILVAGGTQFTGINFTLSRSLTIEHFTFNLGNPLLQEYAVRQAIALGTNRQEILNEAFLPNGIYGMVLNSIVPPEHWASAPSTELTLYTYDPEESRAVLEAAGWIDRDNDAFRENSDGVELAFTFKTTTAALRRASGEIFRQNMEQIGIRINTVYVPALEFFADNGTIARRDFDIAEFAWGGAYDDATSLDAYVTDNSQNHSGYSNSAFDAAMNSAAMAMTNAEKLPYLITAQSILTQDLPILPAFTRYPVAPVPTETGTNITVSLENNVVLHFSEVTASGMSAMIAIDASPVTLPQDFQLLGQVYDIGTSAQFTTAQACFTYAAEVLTLAQETAIRLFHLENNVWMDVTDPGYPDTINDTVCGTVSSFSPFAVMYALNPSDTTPPNITWTGAIADGDSYYFGSVPAEPTCTAVDDLSGVDGSCTVSGFGTTVGTHTLIAVAQDNAGNQATEVRTYTVLSWTLQGFYQPVDMNGVYNLVKNGSTVPIKFEIFVGPTELTSITDIKSFSYTPISCTAGAMFDDVETLTLGGAGLRYDAGSGQFIYNWKTPRAAGRCYQVTVITLDDMSLVAYFKLK